MTSVEYPSCELHPPLTEKTLAPTDIYLELQASREIIKALEEKLECQAAEIGAIKRKLLQETTERLKAEHVLETERVRLEHHAYHDALTQLVNRKFLIEQIEQSLQRLKAQKNTQIAVLLIDLDRFRIVNDSLGYSAGDRILVIIAQHLRSLLRSTDTVARLGGDEFALLLEPIQQQEDAIHCAKRIIRALRLPLQAEGQDIFITPSIGIVIGTSEYDQPVELLRDVDIAMYYAKNSGRACYALFRQEMYTQISTQQQLERDLRQAIEQQQRLKTQKNAQMHICFQPVICLHTDKLIGFEALVRWNHPVQGIIPPSHFIPLAEETGLIIPLGEWVLKATCEHFAQWQTDIELPDDFKVNINVSIKQLQYPHFLKQIDRIFKQTGISGERLRLELTESAGLFHSK
jgi:diguanylate cyclase (GGDEF)-like protein